MARTVTVRPETTFYPDPRDMAHGFGMAVVDRVLNTVHLPVIECPCGFVIAYSEFSGRNRKAIYKHAVACPAAKANRPSVTEVVPPMDAVAYTLTIENIAMMTDAEMLALADRLAAQDDATVDDVMDQLLGELSIYATFEQTGQAS